MSTGEGSCWQQHTTGKCGQQANMCLGAAVGSGRGAGTGGCGTPLVDTIAGKNGTCKARKDITTAHLLMGLLHLLRQLAGNPKYVTGRSASRGKHSEEDDIPRPMSIKERVERDRQMEAAESKLLLVCHVVCLMVMWLSLQHHSAEPACFQCRSSICFACSVA